VSIDGAAVAQIVALQPISAPATTTNHPQRKICEMAGRRPVISQIFLFLNPKTLNDWIYNANDVANTRIRNKTKNT